MKESSFETIDRIQEGYAVRVGENWAKLCNQHKTWIVKQDIISSTNRHSTIRSGDISGSLFGSRACDADGGISLAGFSNSISSKLDREGDGLERNPDETLDNVVREGEDMIGDAETWRLLLRSIWESGKIRKSGWNLSIWI